MKKPFIGITPAIHQETKDITCRPTYFDAIRHAGGIPMLLPLEAETNDLKQLAETLDGFLFTGGPDVHPSLFGEETHEKCGNVSPERDKMELALLPLILKQKKPVLGICRGIQLLNIGLGGTIYQDISSQTSRSFPIAHQQPFYYTSPSHSVIITPDTRLHTICQSNVIQVNSSHHQSVRSLADGLIVTAKSPDGIIEALECPDYPFFIAVQWHPEYLWRQDAAAARLFEAFIHACRQKTKDDQ